MNKNKKRVLAISIVIAVVILIGTMIWIFAPQLMQIIIDMHRAR